MNSTRSWVRCYRRTDCSRVAALRCLFLCAQIRCKSNRASPWARRVHELADRRENSGDGLVMVGELLVEASLQLRELTGELRVGGKHFAQPQKGTHDIDPHLDGFGAVQHISRLNCAVLCESEGWKSRVAVLLRTGRNLRPVQCLNLGARQSKHEIAREPLGVALHLLIEALGRDAVQRGEVG